jgi:acylphosphatase
VPPLHLLVTGRVQGVGFRWYVREAAQRLGLTGWVRNRPDGSVELAADGSPEAQELFMTVVQRGPNGARVAAVERLSGAPVDPPITSAFHVVR